MVNEGAGILFRMRIASYLYAYPEFVYPDEKRVVSCCIRLGYCIVSEIRPIYANISLGYGMCYMSGITNQQGQIHLRYYSGYTFEWIRHDAR